MLRNILQLNVYYFFLQTFVKLLDEIINILDTSVMNVFLESSVFFANIRPSNVQKEFSFFVFFCVFSSLMMDCRNFLRSSVIKMLSLLFLRFSFFIKIELFAFQLGKRHINLTFTVVYRPNNVGAINIAFG